MTRRNQGNRYEIDEWVDFELESGAEGEAQDSETIYGTKLSLREITNQIEFSPALDKARDAFTENANRVVDKWVNDHPDQAADLTASDDYESSHDVAWNTWAHFVGHGVGFWENMTDADYKSLSKAIDSDERLKKAYQRLEDEMHNVVYEAATRAAERTSSNPKRAKSKKKTKPRGSGTKRNPDVAAAKRRAMRG